MKCSVVVCQEHLFCFRSIISNQAMGEEDIDFMLVELDRLGIDL